MVLPVPIITALAASVGLETALGIANRYATGTFTPADDAIIAALGVGVTASALVNPAATAKVGTAILGAPVKAAKKRRRKPSAYNRKFAQVFKEINAKARKKNGQFRKGQSQARVLKRAHAETRRRMR